MPLTDTRKSVNEDVSNHFKDNVEATPNHTNLFYLQLSKNTNERF